MCRLPHNMFGLARRGIFTLLAVACISTAAAQSSEDGVNRTATLSPEEGGADVQLPEKEYHISEYLLDESRPMIAADSSVFYRLRVTPDDSFSRNAEYDLSFVAFARRGVPYAGRSLTLDGVPLHSGAVGALTRLGLRQRSYASRADSPTTVDCGAGGVRAFTTEFYEPYDGYSVGANFASRGYNGGVRASVNKYLGKGWSLAATLTGRTGRDLHIDGVYTNSLDVGMSVVKRWDNNHKLALTALFAPSERGLRSSSTQEAFTLTGNNYYNPSWGLQAGKMRNANVRRTVIPVMVASYDWLIDSKSTIKISLGAELGMRSYSALTWFDAQTPSPDNYRYMPSYFASTEVAGEVESVWRNGDPRYTQIDWDELCEINRLNGGEAVYAVEDRVERVGNIHLRGVGTTRISEALTARYGISYSLERSRNFKKMSDLLGSDYVTDIDYFLVDDRSYRNMLQNDMRHPNRRIESGDRYGYDYLLASSAVGVSGGLEWRKGRFIIDGELSLGDTRIHRRGYYEKELFAGAESYGRSRTIGFTPYAVRATFGYAFSARHNISLKAGLHSVAPDCEDLFLQSRYNNRTIDDPRAENEFSAELNYHWHSKILEMDVTLFAALSQHGVRVAHYYDDLAGLYADMVVSDISWLRSGLEMMMTARFTRHWSASLAAVVGYYGYAKDARVSLYDDSNNALICDHAVAHMGGVRAGNTPQIALSANAAYSNKGWGARLTFNYLALRYVEAEPMRRTDRVSRQGSVSEEMFRRFTEQERLPDAVSADVALWKSFRIERTPRHFKGSIDGRVYGRRQTNKYDRIVVSLSVKNIIGSRNMIYSGRESLRIRRRSIADDYLYEPFASRYTYAYPRTYYLSASYYF